MSATDPTSQSIATALAKIGLALKASSQIAADEKGLTPLQAQALAVLHGRDEPPRSSALAEELAVKRATTTVAVDALVAKGLVRRSSDPEDGRVTLLRLTPKGKRTAASLAGWPELVKQGLTNLDDAQRESFLAVLIAMIRSLQEGGHIPLARMCVSCTHFRANAHPGRKAPHHCAFIDAPLANAELRIDCRDHHTEPSLDEQSKRWNAYLSTRG